MHVLNVVFSIFRLNLSVIWPKKNLYNKTRHHTYSRPNGKTEWTDIFCGHSWVAEGCFRKKFRFKKKKFKGNAGPFRQYNILSCWYEIFFKVSRQAYKKVQLTSIMVLMPGMFKNYFKERWTNVKYKIIKIFFFFHYAYCTFCLILSFSVLHVQLALQQVQSRLGT